jgi:Holliday junction resolvase RusA-like endonuclease
VASVKFELPYPPSVNSWWRFDRRGIAYTTTTARKYKNTAKLLALAQLNAWSRGGHSPHHGPVELTVRVFRPRAQGDLDNTLKVLLDALNGIAYVDDSQVVALHAFRHDDKLKPRVEVEIQAVSPC